MKTSIYTGTTLNPFNKVKHEQRFTLFPKPFEAPKTITSFVKLTPTDTLCSMYKTNSSFVNPSQMKWDTSDIRKYMGHHGIDLAVPGETHEVNAPEPVEAPVEAPVVERVVRGAEERKEAEVPEESRSALESARTTGGARPTEEDVPVEEEEEEATGPLRAKIEEAITRAIEKQQVQVATILEDMKKTEPLSPNALETLTKSNAKLAKAYLLEFVKTKRYASDTIRDTVIEKVKTLNAKSNKSSISTLYKKVFDEGTNIISPELFV